MLPPIDVLCVALMVQVATAGEIYCSVFHVTTADEIGVAPMLHGITDGVCCSVLHVSDPFCD